jgi:hypothetical protein
MKLKEQREKMIQISSFFFREETKCVCYKILDQKSSDSEFGPTSATNLLYDF